MDSVSAFVETHKKLQNWISLLFMVLLFGGWFYEHLKRLTDIFAVSLFVFRFFTQCPRFNTLTNS